MAQPPLGTTVAVLLFMISGAGCAARSSPAAHELEQVRARVVELEEAQHRDGERIEDLSTRLVALEARPVKSRPELRVVRVRPDDPGEVTHPAAKARRAADVDADDEHADTEDDGPRPVLKLYESRVPGALSAAPLGSAPRRSRSVNLASVNERLPVVPIPDVPGTPPLDTAPASLELGQHGGEAAPIEAGPSVEELVSGARASIQAGNCAAALQSLAQVVAQSPEHPLASEAMLMRARCYRRQGASLRAIGELERLGRRYPNSGRRVEALVEMAEAYVSLGDTERARQIFREIMRRYPRSRAASMATARVQELGRGGRAREER